MPRKKGRRKSGDFHMRCDPAHRARWEGRANELGMSLSTYFEVIAYRDIEASTRQKVRSQMHPQSRY
jgi:hypothetical protein